MNRVTNFANPFDFTSFIGKKKNIKAKNKNVSVTNSTYVFTICLPKCYQLQVHIWSHKLVVKLQSCFTFFGYHCNLFYNFGVRLWGRFQNYCLLKLTKRKSFQKTKKENFEILKALLRTLCTNQKRRIMNSVSNSTNFIALKWFHVKSKWHKNSLTWKIFRENS